MAVVTPLNNPGGPEGDTVTVDEQLLNTEYWTYEYGLNQMYVGGFFTGNHPPVSPLGGLPSYVSRTGFKFLRYHLL